jgi:hypothetical protein
MQWEWAIGFGSISSGRNTWRPRGIMAAAAKVDASTIIHYKSNNEYVNWTSNVWLGAHRKTAGCHDDSPGAGRTGRALLRFLLLCEGTEGVCLPFDLTPTALWYTDLCSLIGVSFFVSPPHCPA